MSAHDSGQAVFGIDQSGSDEKYAVIEKDFPESWEEGVAYATGLSYAEAVHAAERLGLERGGAVEFEPVPMDRVREAGVRICENAENTGKLLAA